MVLLKFDKEFFWHQIPPLHCTKIGGSDPLQRKTSKVGQISLPNNEFLRDFEDKSIGPSN